jgi:putative membrane protein
MLKGIVRVLFCAGALALAPFAWAQQQQLQSSFLERAAQDNIAEMELAEIAEERAASEDVKYYAKMLKGAHEVANERLQDIAEQQNVELPDEPNEQQKKTAEKLSSLEGEQFDRQYLQTMIEEHKKAIELFEQQAQSGETPEVQKYAKQTLPGLQAHLEMAQQIEQQIGGGGSEQQRSR